MDDAALARWIARTRWSWTTDEIDATLRVHGLTFTRSEDDRLRYESADLAAIVRLAGPGRAESVAIARDVSLDPDELDELSWDLEVERLDVAFLDRARAIEACLGPPSFFGLAPRARTWDTWPDRLALWPGPTGWLSLQRRQDDTDVPIEVALVVAPPGHVQVTLQPVPIPVAPSSPVGTPPIDEATAWTIAKAAVEAATAGRVDEAAARLTLLLRQVPHFASGWSDLGCIHAMKGAYSLAFKAFDRAIEEDLALLARVTPNRLRALKEAGQARAHYEELIVSVNEGTATPVEIYELAMMLQQQGHAQLCRQTVQRFVAAAGPEYGEAFTRMRSWLGQ